MTISLNKSKKISDREEVIIIKRRSHVNVLSDTVDAISKSNKVSFKWI